MKQLLQSLKDGSTELADVPVPATSDCGILIQTSTTLISAGTERMLVEFGKGSMLHKARSQPDKVKMVLSKAKTDGVSATVDAVRTKLDQPIALGYCNVGSVIKFGNSASGFEAGDRVVSNGKHAEIVSVPQNLCARIPDNVTNETAAFTVLGAIGLQGIRLAAPTLGECVVVIGLGLIGLLTVQMLKAQGCRVLGVDFDPNRLALARKFGAETVNPGGGEDVLLAAHGFSRGSGVDAVIITASTASDEPVHQAANMCRKRGRIVLVGVVGLQLRREDFFEKELSFQVSCSYGPGRYDPSYEEGGLDYPLGFVRWTEQRNFEAVLDLMASGSVDVTPLITHRFEISEGKKAMDLLTADEPSMGILLNYPSLFENEAQLARTVTLSSPVETTRAGVGRVTFIGAGNYAGRVLMRAFKAAGAQLDTVVSSGGVSAAHFGKKFGFAKISTDTDASISSVSNDTVVIATRHNLHSTQVLSALRAGKHVFCEKPLCLTKEELAEIEAEAIARPGQQLMVGFNRRFAPQVLKMKSLLETLDLPKNFTMTVNAGDIPADHWTQDLTLGGGRIIGECCHYIDLLRHLAGSKIVSHQVMAVGKHPSVAVCADKASIMLEFSDGSVGVVNYLANGHKAIPKERLEVFVGGRVLQLDNFRKLRGYGWNSFKKMNLWSMDKGVDTCVSAFLEGVRTGGSPVIPLEEVIEVSRVAIEVQESL